MASLLHRLRSFSPSPVHGSGKGDAGAADMFLVQVIAFGEVFAVPVCKTTPVTVVLRHVMEAAVSEEQATELGDVEATLYYKDKPLQLDAAMATVPRNAVLHLHSSVFTTSSMIHSHRHGAVSMLPASRRRYTNTTVTMHPCLRSKGVVVGGEGFNTPTSHRRSPGFGGLSSDGSPNAELHESPAAARLGSISEYASSAYRDMERMSVPPPPDTTPVMMWPPAMLPMMSPGPATTTAGIDVADVAPCYYFVPCAGATTRTPIRLLSTQGRTVSAPSLTASRRRDSAVDFANSYRCPPVRVSPLDTAAIAAADPSSFSPLPSPPNMVAAAADRFTGSNDKYLVVYLRLPRDQAAACMSAAALNADRNIVVNTLEDEVPVEEMLNATASTVATTKSCATGAYAYRSLRVQRDFPVGTLRELYAVAAEHRLHVAHAEVEDERKSFREMRVAPNTVFYFKRRIDADGRAGMGQRGCQRSLTRERIREHVGATAAVPQPLEIKDTRSAAPHHTPSSTAFARPSAGESFPSGPAPVFSGATPSSRAHNRSQSIARSGTSSSTVSICERIGAFDESAVLNPTHGTEQAARVADGAAEAASATASTDRYVVEGHTLILSSAVAAEEARRAAELAALRAGVGAAGHQQQSPERERSAEDDNSPAAVSPREIGVSVADAEELCTDADCCLPDEAGEAIVTAATATRRASAPQADSVSRVFPETAASASAMDVAASHRETKTYRLQRRSPTVAAAKRKMRIDVLHGKEEETAKGARTAASTQLPKARRMSVLVAKLHGLRGHRVSSTPVWTALTPPHLASEVPLSLSANDLVQPLIDVGESLNPFTTHANMDSPCPLHAAEEAVDAKPKRMRPKGPGKKSAIGEKGVRSLKGTPAASRTASTGSSPAKNKRSNSAPLLQLLRRLSSHQRKADGATQSPSLDKDGSTTTPLAVASSLTPPTPEELKALKHKSNRLSIRKRSEEAVETTAAANMDLMPSSAKATARAAAEAATAASAERSKTGVGDTPDQPKAAREAGSPSRGSGTSYSQRHRRASASVPSQPVAFLGSDPGQGAIITSLAASARAAEDISTTLEPAVLSSTRVPTPRDPHTPLSILVSPSRKQSGVRESNSRAPRSCSSEQASPAASLRRSSVENCTTDYSVETLSSAHRLRITLRDPQDTTRFHYGVPVEPDCPIGALREWIAAMQRPSSEAGEAVLDLRDAKRYGIFLGDTFLPEADSVTFAEVTCGRNDTIFSIRSL
ncbi:hypothetical protein GH5_06049 [Leishmania sp. Ghana 2012 LV757]|uniref:hypothetical protein n=1 Tax=Leishmania sp. Ghana 2012 LV757 TaxID=2803181 RepID=UPI001B4A189D|nr:hypothetical protein GH5_06049 [Leishmania sp. Ghana 2012 LV757]